MYEGGIANDGYEQLESQKAQEQDSDDDVASVEYLSSEEGKRAEKNTWIGIQIKREFGFCQLVALPMVSGLTMSIGGYMTTQLTYMLQEPAGGFNIPKSEIGIITSALTMWSIPFTMVMTAICGYLFEFVGRKWTLFLSYFSTAICFILIPYTAPSYTWLVVVRCAIGITMTAPMAHPLIADYVVRKSRSKGLGLMGIGVVFGAIFSMGVLFQWTKNMTFHDGFLVAGMYVMIMSFLLLAIIKDPNLKSLRNVNNSETLITNTEENESLWTKSKNISSLVGQQLNEKPILKICIIGGTIARLISVLFSTYLILWITFLSNEGDKVNKQLGKQTYINLVLLSVFFSGIAFPVVGKICDTYDASKITPIAFILRGFTCYLFFQIENTTSNYSYIVIALISATTVLEQIAVDSIFAKETFKDTRGMMYAAYSLANTVGVLIYSLIAGYTFDKCGPRSPFVCIGVLDFLFAILFMVFTQRKI